MNVAIFIGVFIMKGVASPHRIWPKYARLKFVFTKILRKHPNIVKIDAIVSYDMKILIVI